MPDKTTQWAYLKEGGLANITNWMTFSSGFTATISENTKWGLYINHACTSYRDCPVGQCNTNTGQCSESMWDVLTHAYEAAAVPTAWTCSRAVYNAKDGCDRNCGAWDPDCDIVPAQHLYCTDNRANGPSNGANCNKDDAPVSVRAARRTHDE